MLSSFNINMEVVNNTYQEVKIVKKTPLYQEHIKLGGNMVDFGGWQLPVQYSSIIEEHEKVRTSAGLFDVSHMGEILVKGEGAEDFLQRMLTNKVAFSTDSQVLYSPMCYPDGGVVDDLLVYKLGYEEYLLVVNASNTDKDYEWLDEHNVTGLQVENVSEKYAQLALQGPKAESILQRLTTTSLMIYPLNLPYVFNTSLLSGLTDLATKISFLLVALQDIIAASATAVAPS
jgi:aminomethyltransferase